MDPPKSKQMFVISCEFIDESVTESGSGSSAKDKSRSDTDEDEVEANLNLHLNILLKRLKILIMEEILI